MGLCPSFSLFFAAVGGVSIELVRLLHNTRHVAEEINRLIMCSRFRRSRNLILKKDENIVAITRLYDTIPSD